MIYIYALTLTNEAVVTLSKMGSVVSADPQEIIVKDLNSFEPISTENDIVLSVGAQAYRQCRNLKTLVTKQLPELKDLLPLTAKKNAKLEAYNLLLSLKDLYSSKEAIRRIKKETTAPSNQISVIDVKDLNLTISDLKTLEENLAASGVYSWNCKLKSNETLTISIKPSLAPVSDLNITFAELYALIYAVEALNVEKITFNKN